MADASTTRPPVVRVTRRDLRGPFTRWPRTADGVLCLLVYVLTVTFTDGPGDTMVVRDFDEVSLPVHALFVVASGVLWWRRSHPLPVVATVLACWFGLMPFGFIDIGWAVLIALYGTGRYSDRDVWGEVTVAVAAAAVVLDAWATSVPMSELVTAVVFMAGVWTVGRSRRLSAERTEQYLRGQAAERRQVVAEERTRIARELHDVVAHRVSLMTVQATAARAVADTDPAAAARAMGAVEEAGRQALDELRHLLGVLRPATEGGARDPQPGIEDLPRLVERVRAAGVEVTLDLGPVDADLPARVGLSAYRIVQEALTNVLKHAGDGASATVRVHATGDGLGVEVTDDGGRGGPGAGSTDDGTGHGLIGMRERTALLGGELEAGPRADGGFVVTARLPLDAASEVDRDPAREARA